MTKIQPETMILDAVQVGNGEAVAAVLMDIGMHCVGCAMASGETIEQACAAHGVDPDEFLAYLAKYLETV